MKMEQLFDTIFTVEEKNSQFVKLLSFDPKCLMIQQTILRNYGTEIGWRFKVMLQVMHKRVAPEMREFAGMVFDSIIHNHIMASASYNNQISIESLIEQSKAKPGK